MTTAIRAGLRVLDATRRALRNLLHRVRRVWQRHLHRLRGDAGYAAAGAALAADVAGQSDVRDLLDVVIFGVAAIRAALRRDPATY